MNNSILAASFFYGMGSGCGYNDRDLIIHAKDFSLKGENMHTHNFFEFDIIIDGVGVNVTAEGRREIGRGTLVFGTPANMHSIAASGDTPLRMFNLQFTGSLERIIIDTFGTFDGFVLTLSEEELEFVSSELYAALSGRELSQRRIFVHGAVMKVIAAVFEAYRRQVGDNRKSESAKNIFEALLYIRRNYSSDLRLEDVARHVSFSADYLGKMIKRRTGKSFMRYLLDLRLDNAYLLLTDSSLTVKEVCIRVGYSSYPNFFYAFVRRFGVKPGVVREMSLEESARHFRITHEGEIARNNRGNNITVN